MTFPPPPAHTAPLPAPVPGALGTRSVRGVPYAAIAGSRPLELDLFLPPEDDAPTPLVVFLHGGGWRAGSRHALGPSYAGVTPHPFEAVAARGIAVASVDYRLSGEALWPAQLHDAKAAVRWLRSRADELGVDPTRIAAWGESAGGHLAALLGLTGPDLEGDVGVTGPSSAVSAVVAWYAPSELATVPTDPTDPTTREALLLGTAPAEVPELAAQASPVGHVGPGAPPFLLLHGAADQLVPCRQSELLHAELTAAGGPTELHVLPGADHMWVGSPDAAATAVRLTTEFLCRTFETPGGQS